MSLFLPVSCVLPDSVGVPLCPVESRGHGVTLAPPAQPQHGGLAGHVLGNEGGVAGQVILSHRVVFLHRPLGEPLLGLGLILGQLGIPGVLA